MQASRLSGVIAPMRVHVFDLAKDCHSTHLVQKGAREFLRPHSTIGSLHTKWMAVDGGNITRLRVPWKHVMLGPVSVEDG